MQITRQADYALRAMIYLAQSPPQERISTGKIAKAQHIPSSFLAKIISQLSIAGLLNTSRGARGGVQLSKPADEITLLEVVEAIDGPVKINECVGETGHCEYEETCPMAPIWKDIHEELVKRLRGTSIGALAKKAS